MNTKGIMILRNIPSKIATFLGEVKLEMKKVNWPTKQETVKYTIIIIGFSVVVALYLGGVDLIFSKLLNFLITR